MSPESGVSTKQKIKLVKISENTTSEFWYFVQIGKKYWDLETCRKS